VKFIADENIDLEIIKELRNKGFDIFSIAEESPGIDDEDVLQITNNHNALLLTGDKDFGELVFRREKAVNGVILIRLIGIPQEEKARIVLETFRNHASDFNKSFTVIGRKKIRIKRIK
jgi:predicted nuclease of predicted toxin-antitoxin system